MLSLFYFQKIDEARVIDTDPTIEIAANICITAPAGKRETKLEFEQPTWYFC